MKQENTVRNTIVKSIRLTPDECARIEGMAKQSNMSFKFLCGKNRAGAVPFRIQSAVLLLPAAYQRHTPNAAAYADSV